MSDKKRKVFGPQQKAKVALEAIRGNKTVNEIAQQFGVHPTQVSQWKKELLEQAPELFASKRGPQVVIDPAAASDRLYSEIGRLKMELDWLKKKVRDIPMNTRKTWVNPEEPLSLIRQCSLSGVSRSSVYRQRFPAVINSEEKLLLDEIDTEYTRHPFYGSRRMVVYLRNKGYKINRKKVQRLMSILGLTGMAPGPMTSRRHPQHLIYPYLLRDLGITKPNQVWSADVTYIRLASGFVYLVAIIDWYSRKVLNWQVSNTLDGSFCVECLETALQKYGSPEIFNSDQGCQFTSSTFIGVLKDHNIQISMDGRGRALDNIFVERLWRSVKYEDIYLKCYTTVPELLRGLSEYFNFYNTERPHQALDYRTPDQVYEGSIGGGALIVNKFTKVLNRGSGQRRAAA